MWHPMCGWGAGWGGGWAMSGMALLWWVLVAAVAVVLFRALRGSPRPGRPAADRALAILRERFARGEIDQAEFDHRMQRLRDGPAS